MRGRRELTDADPTVHLAPGALADADGQLVFKREAVALRGGRTPEPIDAVEKSSKLIGNGTTWRHFFRFGKQRLLLASF